MPKSLAPNTARHRAACLQAGLTESVLRQAYSNPIKFMKNRAFRRVGIEQELFSDDMMSIPPVDWYHPMVDGDNGERVRNATLTPEQERKLFLQYNYAKMQAKVAVEWFFDHPGQKVAKEIATWFPRAMHAREVLVRANLPLVLSMLGKTWERLSSAAGFSSGDCIAEANMALCRAVEGFDVAKGFKFSTYCCYAIIKGFGRSTESNSKYYAQNTCEWKPEFEKIDQYEHRRDEINQEVVEELKQVLAQNSAQLSDNERIVIKKRFNLDGQGEWTLDKVGEHIALTKERVRQIQNIALGKLRDAIELESVHF